MLRFRVNQGPRGLRVFVPVALLLLGIGTSWAGSDLRRGTDGALELQLPVGARGSALGGAVVGDVSGVEAIYWNPAGLAATEHTEVLFTNTRYFADMKLNYIAVVTKVGSFGDLGFNAKVLSIGDVIVTTEDAPEGTGEIISPTFSVLGATWARQFTDRVMFGLSGNYVNERIAQVSASGVAFDFGVQYLTGWQGLKFGMVIKNIGPSMEFGGPGFDANLPAPGAEPAASNRTFRATSASFEMPSFFSLAATVDAMKSPQYRLSVLGAFQNNNFTGDVVRAGAEWAYRDVFALRGAWFGSFESSVDATGEETSSFSSGERIYSGYSLGAGASMRMGETGKLGVDLAWRPVKNFFDDTIEMGLKVSF